MDGLRHSSRESLNAVIMYESDPHGSFAPSIFATQGRFHLVAIKMLHAIYQKQFARLFVTHFLTSQTRHFDFLLCIEVR